MKENRSSLIPFSFDDSHHHTNVNRLRFRLNARFRMGSLSFMITLRIIKAEHFGITDILRVNTLMVYVAR